MPTSPSSAAQAARERVAKRLRELRADAGITGGELAAICGWTHSKSSRIENARTPPSADDIRRWCKACGAADQSPDLIAQSRTAENLYVEWRRTVRVGYVHLQNSYVPLFQSTRLFRIYSATLVPGLLQTEGYAVGLLSSIATFRDMPQDVADAVAARLERSRILHRAGRRFVMVIEEAALHHQVCDVDAMAAQLGYLLTAGALPAVSLGVIPKTTRARRIWPMETFHLYDDTLVSVELLSARVKVEQPSEIELYEAAFLQLQRLAVFGAEARALIVAAIDRLD